MTEQQSGVNVYWDGKTLSLYSGKTLNLPKEFQSLLPSFPIVGQLWFEDIFLLLIYEGVDKEIGHIAKILSKVVQIGAMLN
jgi:hypothetical protein